MFDLIGDIHGHADELTNLLADLGYQADRGVFTHPRRKVVYLGDYIDRGPQIRQVLEIVRGMCDRGSALAIQGNHEFNALCFATEHPTKPGEFLRSHSTKNVRQHQQTLDQLSVADRADYWKWLRSCPPGSTSGACRPSMPVGTTTLCGCSLPRSGGTVT
jgi:hypothetical protein